MKSSSKSLYLQWFAIGVFNIFVCIGLALFITNYLAKKDEKNRMAMWKEHQEGKIWGPLKQRAEILRQLSQTGKMTVDEAYEIVDHAHNSPFPEKSFLLDEKKNEISSRTSSTFDPKNVKQFYEVEITPNRYYRIFLELRRPPHMGPPREGFRNRLSHDGFILGMAGIGAAIIIGIGLSLVVLTIYLRRKAREVENVMSKIKSGDLQTRFNINQTDETGLLMGKFNEMADEIEKLVSNLRNTEESRKRMLQELAHDLRTPVASMKSLQETLFTHGDRIEKEQKDQLQNLAMKEVQYFERLVEDLLFLSGVNDPRYGQAMKCVNLTQLISDESELFDLGKIHVILDSNEEVTIKGDEHLLRRLIKNAFSNAARHARSEVHASFVNDGKVLSLKIRDDGPGLREEDLKSFGEKKFSRQLNDLNTDYISIGLGSVIMKKIMSLHNGDLAIKNTAPGAELELTFPI